tara:strand:+ start:1126 stop:2760 length:1635 start_codon:yes stop_codon:yes gene_type:complete
MAEVINMPRLSDTMEEGTVTKWFKKIGDQVKEGDILAEIETDKATMEFESFQEGELLHIGLSEGDSAPVDSLLAIIGKKGEDISGIINPDSKDKIEQNELDSQKDIVEELDNNDKSENNDKAVIPDDIQIVTMPRLSDTMEEGTVAKWNVKVGQKIKEGDILADIETDKATMEFESFYSGELIYIGIKEGESAKVDDVLAIIGDSKIDQKAIDKIISSSKKSVDLITDKKEPTKPELVSKSLETPSEINIQKVTQPERSQNGRILVSPLAKKIAAEKGINLSHIKGTGDAGRIIKRDVSEIDFSQKFTSETSLPMGIEKYDEVPNSSMRKAIAKRLSISKFTAPHYYLSVEFDMDNAIAFRNQFNSVPNTKISFNDIILKATALALKNHPKVNSQWEDENIIQYNHVHLGVAVAVDDGLIVPVIKFADEMDIRQIGTTVKDFSSRAKEKKLKPSEIEGSTFTVSNLGMFDIYEFTSIINQPNSAILSVGAIISKPVVRNSQVVIGNVMKLTLACDHRSVDGVTGSLFLQTLRNYIENPITLLIS